MRPILVFLMLNFLAATLTNAEHCAGGQTNPDDITLGAVRLTLGMPQGGVLATLGKSYDVEKLKEGQQSSAWLVSTRTGVDKNAPPKQVASVVFRDGQLTTISKNWAPENQQKGFEFATSLYDAMTSFTNEGRTACTIETARKKEPGYETKAIFVTCGAKSIRIDLLSDQRGEFTNMAEVLGQN
jgi:hypothetical protein